jgi:fructokinase
VFGEALVDEFPTEQVVGGAPFNVARHLAAFMAPALMITRIGRDRNGQAVRAEFERFAMRDAGLQLDPMEETGRVVVERSGRARATASASCRARPTTSSIRGGRRQPGERGGRHRLLRHPGPARATLARGPGRRAGGHARQALPRPQPAPGQYDEATVTRSLTAADIVKVNEEELQALFQWYFQIGPNDAAAGVEEVHAACRALMDRFRAGDPDRDPGPPRLGGVPAPTAA